MKDLSEKIEDALRNGLRVGFYKDDFRPHFVCRIANHESDERAKAATMNFSEAGHVGQAFDSTFALYKKSFGPTAERATAKEE